MSADFEGFGEAFQQLQDAIKGPPGGKKMPVWVKYVDVKAGDDIYSIAKTGFEMHAAVSGGIAYNNEILKNSVEEKTKEIIDDLSSKVPIVKNFGSQQHARYNNNIVMLNDNTVIMFRFFDRKHRSPTDLIEITYTTLDENFVTYVDNIIKYHLQDIENMDNSLE